MNPTVTRRVVPALLRQLNEQTVLTTLQRWGPSSRADLCRRTGISGPTVTRVVASLIEAQLVEEIDPPQRVVGRPGKIVRLARDGAGVMALVVGPSHCELAVAGLDGAVEPADVRTFATPRRYGDLLAAVARQARDLVAQRKAEVLGLGISVPGLLNRRQGRSLVSPNVHQLDGRSIGRDLEERLEIDCVVLQECHALCWAEQVYGAARGSDDFAMLDISEGLGLGVMQGGRILEGRSGLAGEFGHMTVELNGLPCGCGNRGCLETVATDAALSSAVSRRLERTVTIDDLIADSPDGRLDCKAEMARTLDYLAVAVAGVINLFNPGKLFIYGRLFEVSDGLFDDLLERTRRRALGPNFADCEIVRARGNKRLGALAAAARAATHGRPEAAG